jgi:hypothetical protein
MRTNNKLPELKLLTKMITNLPRATAFKNISHAELVSVSIFINRQILKYPPTGEAGIQDDHKFNF